MTSLAALILTIALVWSIARWFRPRRRQDGLGVMSQRWVTEERLSHAPDPQR
jgi:hypothetical protein